MAQSGPTQDEFQKQLDDLDRRINQHLVKAREASFWTSEHTEAPAFSTPAPATSTPVKSAPVPVSTPKTSSQPAAKPAPSSQMTQEQQKLLEQIKYQGSNVAPGEKVSPASPDWKYWNEQPAASDDVMPLSHKPIAPREAESENLSVNSTALPSDVDSDPNVDPLPWDEVDALDEGIESRTRVSGTYRLMFGAGEKRTFSLNDSNPRYAEFNDTFLFGEHLMNTYDRAIYNQYKLDIDSQIKDNVSFYTQLVADPWSYSGTSSEIVVPDGNPASSASTRFKIKYWGANNSMIPQAEVRANNRDTLIIPELEADAGNMQPFTINGQRDFFSVYRVPEIDIDYEFRPVRKMWMDMEGDVWHARIFPLADQNQIMTSDDPLGLSNTKDFWQHSAWLDDWTPLTRFEKNPDSAIRRGYYSTEEAFAARDSSGNYLTLLRGAAIEADFGKTYVGAMTASRYGMWDEYQEIDNIPGTVRLKHQLTPQWMIGGLYNYRVAMVDREPDAYNNVISMDTQYYLNTTDYLYGQMAGSRHEVDRLTSFPVAYEGLAYRAGVVKSVGDEKTGLTKFKGDFAWMDSKFQSTLSKYESTADDEFWGAHISFAEIPHRVQPFKIGTGLKPGRYVGRLAMETEAPHVGIHNLLDSRHVRNTDTNGFVEHVIRDELSYQFHPEWKFKYFQRMHFLPATETDVEPYISSYQYTYQQTTINATDPQLRDIKLQNTAIDPGLDPSRFSYGTGLEWLLNERVTTQVSVTRSNDIPDFPRGIQNSLFVNSALPDSDYPGINVDRLQPFLYGQNVYGLPDYEYYTILKERVIWKPEEGLQFIFHAAQNSNRFWAPVDENVSHQGLSIDWQMTDTWSVFTDYTHSLLMDFPKLVNNNFTVFDYDSHHNFYAVLKNQINTNTALLLEYGVFGKTFFEGSDAIPASPFAVTTFSLPTVDTEHIFRVSLEGEF